MMNIPSSPHHSPTLSPQIPHSNQTMISRNLPSQYARPGPGFAAATLTSPCPISTKCVSRSLTHLILTTSSQILRLFPTSPGHDATLIRGQFFAILRLVLHVRGGAELDRNLVFKQGSCSPVFFILLPKIILDHRWSSCLSRTPLACLTASEQYLQSARSPSQPFAP